MTRFAQRISHGRYATRPLPSTWPQCEDALHLGGTGVYNCVVLDVGLPLIDGFCSGAGVRPSATFRVLILTARSAWADNAAGLAAGADDYLTNGFLPKN